MRTGNKLTYLKSKGFTIIEVVLVISIAGLVFTIVFLALPQLQDSRSDNQRRRMADLMAAAISTYKTNNNGSIPTEAISQTSDWQDVYMSNLEDPQTGQFEVSDEPPVLGRLQYVTNEKCEGDSATTTGTEGGHSFAVVVQLEQSTYCVDNI